MTVELDASIVDRARAEFGEGGDSDAAIVESALNALFLDRLLDATQARSDLTPEQAATTSLHLPSGLERSW